MFSFSGSSIQLAGIDLAEMGSGGAPFTQINGESGGFPQLLAQLQAVDGDVSLEQLAENPAMLEDLGLSQEHMEMLHKLMAGGKTLPEAAADVLFELKKQFSDLLDVEPSAEQVQKIEALQQEITALLDILPEELGESINASMQIFRQAFEVLKQEVVAENKAQPNQQDAQSKDVNAMLKNDDQPAANDGTATEIPEDAIQPEVVLASTIPLTQQQAVKQDKVTQKPVQVSMPVAQGGTVNPAAAGLGFNENYGAQTEMDYELTVDGKPVVENRLMPNAAGQQAVSRVAQLQLNEQAMSSQALTRFSGEGTGTGMQSNSGGNTSYTQLMTQMTPYPVTQNIHKPEWGNAIGQRITWMIGNKLQGAQLRITPAHLGPVDIRISIESGVAQVSFVSNHQVVRDALEQAIPRLRDMIEGQELELGDVDISDRSLADSKRAPDEFTHLHGNSGNDVATDPDGTVPEQEQGVVQIIGSDALLDAYA